MWIRVCDTLPSHRKTYVLADELGIKPYGAVGIVVGLWCWASTQAIDGCLQGFPPAAIARATGWSGKPAKLVQALILGGFLETRRGELYIHDWDEYAGKLLDRKSREAERKRRERSQKNALGDSQEDEQSAGRPADSPQDVTRTEAETYSGQSAESPKDVTRTEARTGDGQSAESPHPTKRIRNNSILDNLSACSSCSTDNNQAGCPQGILRTPPREEQQQQRQQGDIGSDLPIMQGEVSETIRLFADNMGSPNLTPVTAGLITQWCEQAGTELVQACIRDVAKLGRKPWAYIERRLKEWYEAGLKTQTDVDAYKAKQEHSKVQGTTRKNPALNYTQHPVDPNQDDGIMWFGGEEGAQNEQMGCTGTV